MYWIEIRNNGKILYAGNEYILDSDFLEPHEPEEVARAKDDSWASYAQKFSLETKLGQIKWSVEYIEYLNPPGATLLGQSIDSIPEGSILIENIEFQMQDGWL